MEKAFSRRSFSDWGSSAKNVVRKNWKDSRRTKPLSPFIALRKKESVLKTCQSQWMAGKKDRGFKGTLRAAIVSEMLHLFGQLNFIFIRKKSEFWKVMSGYCTVFIDLGNTSLHILRTTHCWPCGSFWLCNISLCSTGSSLISLFKC